MTVHTLHGVHSMNGMNNVNTMNANIKNMNSDYRYKLEKGSKKHPCPSCGKKRYVRFVDLVTGEYLPEVYGACDRSDNCAYNLNPYTDGYVKTIWLQENGHDAGNWKPSRVGKIDVQKKEVVYIPNEVLHGTLAGYELNGFVQNLLNNVRYPFLVADVERAISQYYIGTISQGYRNGAVTFPFIDENNNVRAIQVKQFDKNNHTTATDFIHSIISKESLTTPKWISRYNENETKVSCLFGAHLLKQYPSNPIALVEAPKGAFYGALYFGGPDVPDNLLWLSTYNLSSLTLSKCKALAGRDVYLFPDLSKSGHAFNEWSNKAIIFQKQMPGTRFVVSDLLERLANDEQRAKGCDIADILIQQDWRAYRKSEIDDENDAPNKTFLDADITDSQLIEEGNKNVCSKTSLMPLPSSTVERKIKKYDPTFDITVFTFNEDSKSQKELFKDAFSHEIDEMVQYFKSLEMELPKFVDTHLMVIKNGMGLRATQPYYDRLLLYKNELETMLN